MNCDHTGLSSLLPLPLVLPLFLTIYPHRAVAPTLQGVNKNLIFFGKEPFFSHSVFLNKRVRTDFEIQTGRAAAEGRPAAATLHSKFRILVPRALFLPLLRGPRLFRRPRKLVRRSADFSGINVSSGVCGVWHAVTNTRQTAKNLDGSTIGTPKQRQNGTCVYVDIFIHTHQTPTDNTQQTPTDTSRH